MSSYSPQRTTGMRYQQVLSLVRQYDRDTLLFALAQASTTWTGRLHDKQGRRADFLPWDIAGLASITVARGTSGGKNIDLTGLQRLSKAFASIPHPAEEDVEDHILRAFSRYIYQQAPFQNSSLVSRARSLLIFAKTEFSTSAPPAVMLPGWDSDLFGCDIDVFLSVGMLLQATAGASKGLAFPIEWKGDTPTFLPALGGEDVVRGVIEKNYSTTVEEFKTNKLAHLRTWGLSPVETFKYEPFAMNPLLRRPLLSDIFPDRMIAPCVPAIELRSAAAGIIADGLDHWGSKFASDAGQLFENYVGQQLRLIQGVDVLPEITYGLTKRQKAKSIDWFVVCPNAVLLIECKVTRPHSTILEARAEYFEAHTVLAKAISQINNTETCIVRALPEFTGIPTDRPHIGLIVTLDSFELANDPQVRELLPVPKIPTAIIGVDLLEQIVTAQEDEIHNWAASAHTHLVGNNSINIPEWTRPLSRDKNPLLEAAFDELTVTRIYEQLIGTDWRTMSQSTDSGPKATAATTRASSASSVIRNLSTTDGKTDGTSLPRIGY